MKHLVVGTAGHIDHGKTTLIKGLTTIETDRLEEEKKRGITIVLGYAHFKHDEDVISFVDVPGHEKFIKTMLSGATGIDMVMLVISADEGIMPQTIEHFTIIKHLGIQEGIIVLTKTDRVDQETINRRELEIKHFFKGTFLEVAPIFKTTITDPQAYVAIQNELINRLREPTLELSKVPPRMYIDRIFSLKGMGTVVTGTLIEGSFKRGDRVWIYPGPIETRIKTIQVHGESAENVYYGNRVALNLSCDLDVIPKGALITTLSERPSSFILDVTIDADEHIRHWDRVRFFHGTSEVMGRIALPNQDEVIGGSTVHAQIRLENPVYVNVGDPYVIRQFSPVVTIGGGQILNTQGQKRHFTSEVDLNADFSILKVIDQINGPFQITNHGFASLSLSDTQLTLKLNHLVDEGLVAKLSDKSFISKAFYESQKNKTYAFLEQFHDRSPYKLGIKKAELKSKIFNDLKKQEYDKILDYMIDDKTIKTIDQWISIYDFEIIEDSAYYKTLDQYKRLFSNAESPVISVDSIKNVSNLSQNHSDVLTYLNYREFIVKISEDQYILGDLLKELESQLLNYFNQHSEISVAAFRDLTKSSRKVSVVVLEYFDGLGLTKRIDNIRILNK